MKNKMIGILVVVFFLFCIAQIGEAVKPKCMVPGCDNERTSGSKYCFLHDRSYYTYGNPDYHAVYQQSRERQKRAADTYSANKTGVSGRSTNSSAFSGGGTGNGKYSNSSSISSKHSNSSSTSSKHSNSSSTSSKHSNSRSASSKHSNSSSTSNKLSNSTGSRSVDPYDAYEFDNADDFADEWAEEFGDGDFEEGYEDAYDYWKYEYGG